MEVFFDTIVIAGAVVMYAYVFCYVCSVAYFRAKLAYQNSFFRKFDPTSKAGDK